MSEHPIYRSGLAAVPYDYASLVEQGSLLFTAGACPLNAAGTVVAPGDHFTSLRSTPPPR